MRLALVVAVATLALASPLAGASKEYFVTGTFSSGSPRASATDACLDPTQEGRSSSCDAVPAGEAGATYTLHASGLGGAVVDLSACFYSAARVLIHCDAEGLPSAPKPAAPSPPQPPLGAGSVPGTPKLDATVVGTIPSGAAFVSVGADAGLTVAWSLRAN